MKVTPEQLGEWERLAESADNMLLARTARTAVPELVAEVRRWQALEAVAQVEGLKLQALLAEWAQRDQCIAYDEFCRFCKQPVNGVDVGLIHLADCISVRTRKALGLDVPWYSKCGSVAHRVAP